MRSALELLREMRTRPINQMGLDSITQNYSKDTKPTLAQFAESGEWRRIWSVALGEEIILAADNANVPETTELVVYRARELGTLPDITPDGLRRLHEVKKVFGGTILPD